MNWLIKFILFVLKQADTVIQNLGRDLDDLDQFVLFFYKVLNLLPGFIEDHPYVSLLVVGLIVGVCLWYRANIPTEDIS